MFKEIREYKKKLFFKGEIVTLLLKSLDSDPKVMKMQDPEKIYVDLQHWYPAYLAWCETLLLHLAVQGPLIVATKRVHLIYVQGNI